MKKISIFILVLLLTAMSGWAATYTVTFGNTVVINGTTVSSGTLSPSSSSVATSDSIVVANGGTLQIASTGNTTLQGINVQTGGILIVGLFQAITPTSAVATGVAIPVSSFTATANRGVYGTNIPAGASVATSPAPTASSFSLTAPVTGTGIASNGTINIVTQGFLATITNLTVNGALYSSVPSAGPLGLLVNGVLSGNSTVPSTGRCLLGNGAVVDGTSINFNIPGLAIQNNGAGFIIRGTCYVSSVILNSGIGAATSTITLGAASLTSNISLSSNTSSPTSTKTFAIAGTNTTVNLCTNGFIFAASQTIPSLGVLGASTIVTNAVTATNLSLYNGVLTTTPGLTVSGSGTVNKYSNGSTSAAVTYGSNVNVTYKTTATTGTELPSNLGTGTLTIEGNTIATTPTTHSSLSSCGDKLYFSNANAAGIAVGQLVYGPNIPVGTTVTAVSAADLPQSGFTQITLSNTIAGVVGSVTVIFVNPSTYGSVTLGSNVSVSNLSLTSGSLVTATNKTVTIASAGTVTRTIGSVNSTAQALVFGSNTNVTYTGSVTTGSELPTNLGTSGTLTINHASGVTLNAAVTTNALTLTTGKLVLGANNITVSSISGGSSSSYVNASSTGRLIYNTSIAQNASVTFSIGSASSYTPLIVTPTSGAASNPLTVGLSTQGITGQVNYKWYLSANSGVTANVGFQFPAADTTGVFTAGSNAVGYNDGTSFSGTTPAITVSTTSNISSGTVSLNLTNATSGYYVIGNTPSSIVTTTITQVTYTGASCGSGTVSFTVTGASVGTTYSIDLYNSSNALVTNLSTSVLPAGTSVTLPSSMATGSYIRVSSSNPGGSGNSSPLSIPAGLWTGAANGDFNSASNWCSGVAPTSSTDVEVSNGNMPKLSANIAVRNLTLTNTLLDLNGYRLTITGTTAYSGSGAIRGSAASSITGASTSAFGLTLDQTTVGTSNALSNLTINGASGLLTINNNTQVSSLTVGDSVNIALGVTLKYVGTSTGLTRTAGSIQSPSNGASTFEIAGSGGFSDTIRLIPGLITNSASSTNLVNLTINNCSVGLHTGTANTYYVSKLTFSNNGLFTTGATLSGTKIYVADTLTGTGRFQFAGTTGNQRIYLRDGATVKNLNLTGLNGLANTVPSLGSWDGTSSSASNGNVTFTGTNVLTNVRYSMDGNANSNTQQVIFSGSNTSLAGFGGTTSSKTMTADAATTLTITGAAVLFPTTGSNTVGTLSVQSGTTLSGSLTVANALNVSGATLVAGTNLTLSNGVTITRKEGSITGTPTFGTSVNVVYADTSAAVTTGAELPTASGILRKLYINSGGGVTLNSAVTVNDTLFLQNGTFTVGANLTLASGKIIDRLSGTISSAPQNTDYSVNYSGTSGVQNTGNELPTWPTQLVGTLKISNASGVVLGDSANVSTVDLSAGKLTLGSYNFKTAAFSNANASNFVNCSGTGNVIVTGVTTSTKVLPLGYGNSYAPLTVTLASGSTTIYASAAARTQAVSTPANVITTQWDIQADNATSATVVFTYPSSITPGFVGYNDGNGWTTSAVSSGATTTATATFTLPLVNNTFVLSTDAASLAGTGSISVGTLSFSSACAGTNVSIPYTASGSFSGGNVFTAKISNTAGTSYSISIGSITDNGSNTISGVIPSNAVAGSAYKIQVSSSSGLSATSATFTINAAGTWIGSNGASAKTASNWCGGVPTSSTAIVVANTTPTLDSNLTVASAAISSGFNLNGYGLTITGSLSGAGSIASSNSASSLSLGGGTLNMHATNYTLGTLTTTGASSVTLTSALNTNAINVVNGGISLATNVFLKLTGTTLTRTTGGTITSAVKTNGSSFEIANTRDSVSIPPALFTSNTNLILGNSGVITGTSTPSFIKIDGASGVVTAAGHATVSKLTFKSGSKLALGFINGASGISRSIAADTLTGTGSYGFYNNSVTKNSRILISVGGKIDNFVANGVGDTVGVALVGIAGNYTISGTTTINGGLVFNSSILAGGSSNSGNANATHTVTLASGSVVSLGSANNLTISAINTNSGMLTDNKSFIGNGASLSLTGTLSSPSVNFTSSTLNNFTISNVLTNRAVALSGTLTINGVLTINGTRVVDSSGTFALGNSASGIINETGNLCVATGAILNLNNRPFTIKSSSTGRGVIGRVNGTLSGATNVMVERYIPMGLRAYRDLSPGVTTSTSIFANWQEGGDSTLVGYGTYITGAVGSSRGDSAGLDKSYSGSRSLYQYVNGTWSAVINTKDTLLSATKPYRILIRGDRRFNIFTTPQGGGDPRNGPGPMQSPTVLRATGTLYTGVYSPSINGNLNGFTIVANPYVSPISWHSLVKNNISSSFWYLDPTIGNANKYVVYNATTGTNNYSDDVLIPNGTVVAGTQVTRDIQPGQAFFVKTTGASPSLTINEASKTDTTASKAVFSVDEPMGKISIALTRQSPTSTAYNTMDGAVVVFRSDFSNDLGDEDSYNIKSATDNLAIANAKDTLSIEGRALPTERDSIAFVTTGLFTDVAYRLRINASSYAAGVVAPYLFDKYKNTTTALSTTEINNFDFMVDANAASSGQRFSLVFKPTVLAVNSIVVAAKATASGVLVNWNTVGEHGAISYEVERSTNGISFSKQSTVAAKNTATASYSYTDGKLAIGDNYYRIKAIGTTGVNYSQVVLVKVGVSAALVSVYPNPLSGNKLVVNLSSVAAGNYRVRLHNSLGQQVVSQLVKSGAEAVVTVGTLAAGNYQVSVSDANGNPIYQTKLVAAK